MPHYNYNPPNHTALTLGQLLSSTNETIQRNAISILKTLQRLDADEHAHKQTKYFDRSQYDL